MPDVHGRKFWHKAEEMINEVDKVVFLGDYLDPYSSEGITEEDALTELQEIVKFKEKYVDKVVLLLGNHDLPYLFPEDSEQVCRHCWSIHEEAVKLFDNIYQIDIIYIIDKYLFSHAGVNKGWLEDIKIDLEDLNYDFKVSDLEMIGCERGGWSLNPSCVWADIYEHYANLDGYYQIFGHTQLEKEFITDKYACLDCRKCFILDTENAKISKC